MCTRVAVTEYAPAPLVRVASLQEVAKAALPLRADGAHAVCAIGFLLWMV